MNVLKLFQDKFSHLKTFSVFLMKYNYSLKNNALDKSGSEKVILTIFKSIYNL